MYTRRHFPNQQPNEHVLMFLRRHWIVTIKIIILNLILAAIPVIFYIGLINYTTYLDHVLYYPLFLLLVSAFYLFVILFSFSSFIDYYLDVWIVTNKRIINIEQKGLFSREVSEKELGNMQDITSDIEGFWGTVLNYGSVYMQTAGAKGRFAFKQIPFADEVARRISNLVSEYKKMDQNTPLDKI